MTYFDWRDFFNLAEELSNRNDEACIRSAISRYYYSAFCSARYYLVEIKGENQFLTRRRIHTKLYEYLKNSDDDNEAELGELLEILFEKRNCADYDWQNTNKDYFSKQLPFVQNEIKKAFLNINALKNNPSNFRIS